MRCQHTYKYETRFQRIFKVELDLFRYLTTYIVVLNSRVKISASRRSLCSFSALTFTLLLSACATAPAPKISSVASTSTAPPSIPSNIASIMSITRAHRLDTKLNVEFDWWKLLQSSQLNTLIEQGFAAYPSVESVQRLLLKVQQSDIVRSGYFHSAISVNDASNGLNTLSFQKTRSVLISDTFVGDSYYGFHARQLAISYLPEALHISSLSLPKSTNERRQLQAEATYRTLASNLIACVLQESSLHAQMRSARKIIAIDLSLLSILRKQHKVGLVTQSAVSKQKNTVHHSQQALLLIHKQFTQTRELLHLLLGIPPEDALPESVSLNTLHSSLTLPLEVPTTLVAQRPDVRAAQLEMQTNSAKYQNTMKMALKNTEDTLIAIYSDAIKFKAATASEQESLAALTAMRHKYAEKSASYRDLLAAQQNLQLAKLRLIQCRTETLGNAIALYHSLGGAWWNKTINLEIASNLQQTSL